METPAKPLRGINIVRKLLEVKQQVQREAVESFQKDPEIRAIYEQLKEENHQERASNR